MAVGPFPLWRPVDPTAPPDEEQEPSGLPAVLDEWDGIYRAMARIGFGQADVDEMELWVIARILNPPGEEGPEDEAAFMERSRQEAAARGRGASPGFGEA